MVEVKTSLHVAFVILSIHEFYQFRNSLFTPPFIKPDYVHVSKTKLCVEYILGR